MKVIVYGLGIIGASVAASLKAAGHEVLGKNRSRESVVYALEHGMIDGEAHSLCGADVVFLALPPRVTMRVLDEGAFSDGCIVADICGVKVPVEEVVLKKPRAWRYVGTHPMAGKETSGIRSASAARGKCPAACSGIFHFDVLIINDSRPYFQNFFHQFRRAERRNSSGGGSLLTKGGTGPDFHRADAL